MYNNYVINNRIKRVKKLIVNCIKENDTNQATEYLDIFTNLILWKFDGPLTLSKQREFNRQILFMQNNYLAMSLSNLSKVTNKLNLAIKEATHNSDAFRYISVGGSMVGKTNAMNELENHLIDRGINKLIVDFNPNTGNAFIEQALSRAKRTTEGLQIHDIIKSRKE